MFTRIGLIYKLNNNSIKENEEDVSFLTFLLEVKIFDTNTDKEVIFRNNNKKKNLNTIILNYLGKARNSDEFLVEKSFFLTDFIKLSYKDKEIKVNISNKLKEFGYRVEYELTEFTKTTVFKGKTVSDEQILKEEFYEILKKNDFVEDDNLLKYKYFFKKIKKGEKTMSLYRLGYNRYYTNKEKVLEIEVSTKLFEKNDLKEILFISKHPNEILGVIPVKDLEKIDEIFKANPYIRDNKNDILYKDKCAFLKNIEIDDLIETSIEDNDFQISLNAGLLWHLGYYLEYDIKFYSIKEKEAKKEITKDEFVKILLENNFKEFPINTKKKNNILKKILVTKE